MKSFADQLHEFSARIKGRGDAVVAGVVHGLAVEIDKRSPVGDQELWLYNRGTKDKPDYVHYLAYRDADGYVGGHFRANWQLGIGSLPDGIVQGVDPSGGETQDRILAAIPEDAAGRVYYIANNLPYAQRLEHGWSTQAPAGMVGLAITMFSDIVDATVTEVKADEGAK